MAGDNGFAQIMKALAWIERLRPALATSGNIRRRLHTCIESLADKPR